MIPSDRLKNITEYYFSRKLKEVAKLKADGNDILNLGIGSPDLSPPQNVIQKLQETASEPKANMYQSYMGIPELRKEMTRFYKNRFGVTLDSENEVLPLMGSKEGIMFISMAFLNAGDEVLIPNPGYPTYSSVTKILNATPRFYNLNQEKHWTPDLKAIEKQDLTKVKLMWINYPNMPTGAVLDKDKFNQIIDFGKRYNILIINDNPYSFILNKNPMSLLEVENAKEYGLELNSLSKIFNMSGWRVGMVMGNKEHINTILKVKSNFDSGMYYPIQAASVKALSSPDAWFSKINTVYQERKELVFNLLGRLNCSYEKASSGLFVWGKLPKKNKNSESFVDRLLYEKHIFVTPGKIFGSNGEGYIRISLCIKKELISEAIKRI